MRKKSLLIRIILCVFMLVFMVQMADFVSAESAAAMRIEIRIEGITKNLFYGTEDIPYSGTLSVKQVLEYLDERYDTLSISGLAENFVSAVNTDASASFGGWDGWLYRVNNSDASVGIQDYQLQSGDRIVLYYGDPFGVGFQYPEMDASAISQGLLTFTSRDTTYDAEYNPTTTVNPVVGASVKWYTGDSFVTYTTDANGQIQIKPEDLMPGSHPVQAEKWDADKAFDGKYLPLILRLAPDAAVTVPTPTNNPSTGYPSANWLWAPTLLLGALISAVMIFTKNRRKVYPIER